MYKPNKPRKSKIHVDKSYKADSLEVKLARMVANKEPMNDMSPLIYTERKDGVQPAYNIRTDKMELALDALGNISKMRIAKREEKGQQRQAETEAKVIEIKTEEPKTESGA